MSIKEAALLLRLSESMMRGLISSGRIAYVQIGKSKKLIQHDAIERFIEESTVDPWRDATTAPNSGSSKSAASSISLGPNTAGAASAALGLLTFKQLRSSSQGSSARNRQDPAPVIPLRSS
jgi:excisionase family DNA binding protein